MVDFNTIKYFIVCRDLMRGLCVKTMKLKGGEGEKVFWNAEGSKYAIIQDKKVTVTDINSGEELFVWTNEQRLHHIQFALIKNGNGEQIEVVLAAGEDKMVYVLSADEKKCIKTLDISAKSRIKDFRVVNDGESLQFLITCTSDGTINVTSFEGILLNKDTTLLMESVAEYSTGCRLVCMDIVNLTKMGMKEKRIRITEEVQSEVESEFEMPKTEKVTISFEGDVPEIE